MLAKNCSLCCCFCSIIFVLLVRFLSVSVFVRLKSFRKKKINRFKIIFVTSINYTTDVYTPQPTYREFICTHLFLLVIICKNIFFLWESFWISSYLWESLLIYDHLWVSLLFMRISLNLFLLMVICQNLFFKSLWKWVSVWTPSFRTDLLSSKHDNDILSISYIPTLCFLAWILLILCLIIILLNKVSLNSLNSVAIFTPFAVLDSLPSIFFYGIHFWL